MYIRSFDYLSPPITLFYKGLDRHKSIFSGIFTLLAYAGVLVVCLVFILQLFDKTNPTAFFSNRFIADVGEIPMDNSMLFHYYEVLDFGTVPKKDFVKYFRIQAKTDLEGPDYWLYDYCTPEDFGPLYNEDAFLEVHDSYQERLCIRYYWKASEGKYLKTGDPGFPYPKILHGLNHPNYTYYQANLEMCKNGTEMDLVLPQCETPEALAPFNEFHVLAFVFADHDVDINDYDHPIKVLNYKFWSAKYYGGYWTNQLNLNTILLKTHKGLISDKIKEDFSLAYANHGWGTTNDGETGLNHIYNVYVMSRQNVYDRSYKKLTEVLAQIGGMTQVIITLATFINFLANRYCQFLDCEEETKKYSNDKSINSNKITTNLNSQMKIERSIDNLAKDTSPKIYQMEMALRPQNEGKKAESSNKRFIGFNNRSSINNLNDRNNKTKDFFRPKTVFNKKSPNFFYFKKINFCSFLGFIICKPFKNEKSKRMQYAEFIENLFQLIISEETLYDVHFFLEYYLKTNEDNSRDNS